MCKWLDQVGLDLIRQFGLVLVPKNREPVYTVQFGSVLVSKNREPVYTVWLCFFILEM